MRLLNDIRNSMTSYQVKSGVYHFYRNEHLQAIGFLRKALDDTDALDDGERTIATTYLVLALKGRACALRDEGKADEALAAIRDAIERSDRYPDLHVLEATIHEALERPADAIAAYRAAIELNPSYLEAHVELAYRLAESGRTDDAADAFQRAWTIRAEQLEQRFRTGLAMLRDADPAEGTRAMDRVFRTPPGVAAEHEALAQEACRAERWEEALEQADEALRLNPDYPDLHNLRGVVLYETGRFAEAAAAFERATALCPEHLVPRQNRAWALAADERIAEAIDTLETVLSIAPADPLATPKLAALAAARGERRPIRDGAR